MQRAVLLIALFSLGVPRTGICAEPTRLSPVMLDLYIKKLTSSSEPQRNATVAQFKSSPEQAAAVFEALTAKSELALKELLASKESDARIAHARTAQKLHAELAVLRQKIGVRPPAKGGDPEFVQLVDAHQKYFNAMKSYWSSEGALERSARDLQRAVALLKPVVGKSAEGAQDVQALLWERMPPELKTFIEQEEKYYNRARQVLVWNRDKTAFAQDYERTGVGVFNQYRLLHGVQPAELEECLHTAARKHTQEQVDMNYFGHESPVAEHKTWDTRIRLAGYSGSPHSEDCAMGMGASKQGAINNFGMWVFSPGHHAPIRHPNMNQVAIGMVASKATACFGENAKLLSSSLDASAFDFSQIEVDHKLLRSIFNGPPPGQHK